mmetsp:Transcript_41466/g.72822  ORF Transcript_41466/g.72822 Transcript_41466/m.72822 type:complete len:242 (+) Transcript_41466:104-829(+)
MTMMDAGGSMVNQRVTAAMLPSAHEWRQEPLTLESKERTKATLKKLLTMFLVIPTTTSLIFFFMELIVVADAFRDMPGNYHDLRLACAGNEMHQAAARLKVCENIEHLFEKCTASRTVEECNERYEEDIEVCRSQSLWWPIFFLLVALCITASATPCGFLGIRKDNPTLTQAYAIFSAASLPLYAGACICCCQFHLVVHIALSSFGAYFGFVYHSKQVKMAAILSPPSAQLQATYPQPSTA